MKTMTWLLHLRPPNQPKTKPAVKIIARSEVRRSAKTELKAATIPFADDASPPGYKIRWHI